MQKRRPCDGDHTQHPSGTAERNTLWHWFSVTLLPRWEGRRWNGMVKGPKAWRCFNIEVSHLQRCDDDARGRRGKGFRGSSMNHHGNKQRKSGVTACTTVRQVRLQPPPVASSLAIRHWGGGWPPAEVGWEPFVQGWTHTHTRTSHLLKAYSLFFQELISIGFQCAYFRREIICCLSMPPLVLDTNCEGTKRF